jgi:hypothetical protein
MDTLLPDCANDRFGRLSGMACDGALLFTGGADDSGCSQGYYRTPVGAPAPSGWVAFVVLGRLRWAHLDRWIRFGKLEGTEGSRLRRSRD